MKKRHIKVRDTYYEHHLKKWPQPPRVPKIEPKGYWLNQIGFEIGKQLQVLPGTDHIVITLALDKTSSFFTSPGYMLGLFFLIRR